jgi:hypothetical protein
MEVLLLHPKSTDTFWSFKHTLKFIGKRAALPPLGLLTVAAMLITLNSTCAIRPEKMVKPEIGALSPTMISEVTGHILCGITIRFEFFRQPIAGEFFESKSSPKDIGAIDRAESQSVQLN